MLDLKSLERRPPVTNALADLSTLTSRPLRLRHMNEWVSPDPGYPQKLPSPALIPFDDRDEVYLNETLPEHMAVHEIVHAILREEGHPDYRFDESKITRRSQYQGKLTDQLTHLHNKFQHPEVYRRMAAVYDLEMEQYLAYVARQFSDQTKQHINGKQFRFVFGRQAQVLNVVDLLNLFPRTKQVLALVKAEAPSAYRTAIEAKDAMDSIGTTSLTQALAAVNAVWERIIAMGKTPDDEETNDLWRAVTWFLPKAVPSSVSADIRDDIAKQ